MIEANSAQHPWADLLVAAPDDVALTTDGGDQQARRIAVDQFEQLCLGHITRQYRAILNHVDAQQRGLQAEVLRQAVQGRARAEDIAHALFPAFLQPVGQVDQYQLLGLHAGLLGVLHKAAFDRHGQLAVPTGAYLAIAQRRFVEVAHFAAGQAYQAAFHQAQGQLAGGAWADGVDPGMNLDPGRNAQHRLLLAYGGTDITGGTIAAGKQDQRTAGLLQRLHGALGIGGAGRALAQITQHAMGIAQLSQQISAHRPGKTEELQAPGHRAQAFQGDACALRGARLGATGQGLVGHPVATLERRSATQARQGVDDQTDVKSGAHADYRSNYIQSLIGRQRALPKTAATDVLNTCA